MASPNNHPRQLKDFAVDQLREMISRGELGPGEWLRQERLSEALGVSFTPIREALKQLEAEGLVEHVPYRGVRVAVFSADDVRDIYDLRAQLEGQAARSAATRLTPGQIAELRSLHEGMAALSYDQIQRIRELNRRFHSLIIEASGRTYLARILNMIWTWFPTMLWSQSAEMTVFSEPDRAEEDSSEHAQIVAAFEARDPDAAERAMRAHIEQARASLLEFLEQSMPQGEL